MQLLFRLIIAKLVTYNVQAPSPCVYLTSPHVMRRVPLSKYPYISKFHEFLQGYSAREIEKTNVSYFI